MRQPHVLVKRAGDKQLLLRARSLDRAVFEHDNVVGIFDRGQAVRDDEQRLALRQRGDAALELVLIFGIGEGRGLVQNDDGRVFEHHARDGDALLFAAGEALARLARRRVVALRELFDEFLALRGARRGPDLLVRRARIAEADVFKQRTVEEEIILRNKADVFRELRERHILDIHSADRDLARAHIPESRDELRDRRLAAARRADERGEAALGER